MNPVSSGTHASHGTDVFRLQGLVGARRLLQTLERSLREPRELPDSPEPMPRMGQMSSAYKYTLAWSGSLRGGLKSIVLAF